MPGYIVANESDISVNVAMSLAGVSRSVVVNASLVRKMPVNHQL